MKREKITVPVTLLNADVTQMSEKDRLKARSEGLFYVADGDQKKPFAVELDALTAGGTETISEAADAIAKHFGIYKQRERDASGGKTGDYIFMVRVKNPAGGELTAVQWAGLDEAAERFADKTLRLTSREGIQFHFVYGRDLAALIRHLNAEYRDRGCRLTTLGACGDVNRNTMCSPIDDLDADLPLDSRSLAHAIARELAPRSSAYAQIFLSDEEGRTVAPLNAEEPIYGAQYLPRKFKVGIAHPRDNSIDLLTQDVGFLPVVNGMLAEHYDLYTGGGLGTTHNLPETQQLLGLYLGRVPREQVVDTVRAIAILQKEHGERKNRRQARWKYTLRRLGVDPVKAALRARFGIRLMDAEPQPIPKIRYHHGWHPETGGGDRYYFGLPVEVGRLRNTDSVRMRAAVREIVETLDLGVRVTPNQDLLLCHVPAECRAWVEQVLRGHGVPLPGEVSRVRSQGLACPAKPTCGLAMTDAERLLPVYMSALEEAGLGEVDVIIRMAGCPNVCSRPPTAEIGIYGYGKNDYVIQVGGARDGTRLGKILYERAPGEQMVAILQGLVQAIRDSNPQGLPAGEFLHHTPAEQLRRLVGI
ncbi:MAG: NADPH-dependent assimilatory sulfite reductase hemoprotein subunit [Betaproteobacteria bacterium]|nr:NADPH-dependent assimilatory sulfite reductase hemoprotein subunit [Betaproteobacteria bacterium]